MPTRHSIKINVDPPYEVAIGSGLLAECGERIKAVTGLCRVAVITDTNVAPLYLETAKKSLLSAGFEVCSLILPAGEQHKNMDTLSDILEQLAQNRLTRSDCIVALGGGVVGDMAGFAAGVYLRGIRCVQLPTTLLAAVDSSVGGKTAVDLKAGKNLAGVFLQPCAVLCDTDCLKTLSPETYAEGMAEAIKTGVLAGEELFSLCESGGDVSEIIALCVAHKGSVVEQDEREQGLRKTLNLGHTAAHSIELLSNYTISHGKAVAIGTAIISRAAERLGWCEDSCAGRITAALGANALPTKTNYTAKELSEAALADKKRSGDKIALAVPVKIGGCELKAIGITELEAVFRAGLEE